MSEEATKLDNLILIARLEEITTVLRKLNMASGTVQIPPLVEPSWAERTDDQLVNDFEHLTVALAHLDLGRMPQLFEKRGRIVDSLYQARMELKRRLALARTKA